jgi:two-component system, NtrC family, C4-dicarboxylate transport response regulator DctD
MIYLIDDDKSVRRGLTLFFKAVGLDFVPFASADEYLANITADLKDIIILDLNLPVMNGIDFLKKLESEGIHLKVIVVTAFDDPLSRDYCVRYGVKAYMRKPVDGDALMDLIRFNM